MSIPDRTTTAESSTPASTAFGLAADGPSLPATLAVGVATLLSAIAFAVSAFISVTGDSQALPSGAIGASATTDVVAAPGPVEPAAVGRGRDLEPTWCESPVAECEATIGPLHRALIEFSRFEVLLESTGEAAPASTGSCPLVPAQVAPAGDRARKLRVHVVERATAPA